MSSPISDSDPIPFSGGTLDRADVKRRDAEWIAARLDDDRSRFLPVWRLAVLVRSGDAPRLAWATPDLRDSLAFGSEPIFLGLDGDDVAHFAVDISDLAEPVEEMEWTGVASFPELRAIAAQLPAGEAGIAAHARHLVDWHQRHGFCPGCGSKTRVKDAGYARVCTSDACSTEHFPRTDPVVIMLVADDHRCLLGRQSSWPHPFHSALAGFVEAGETLEEAVRREVMEEAGIEVGDVRYHASQPWPFPASLMIGCIAEPLTSAITVDGEEIESAEWFDRDSVLAALEKPTARLAVPPPLAIAHHLVRAWATGKLR